MIKKIEKNLKRNKENILFFVWLLVLFIYVTFFNITFVSGNSMNPSLKDKDILIMEKASILLSNLNRGDIVSFKHNTGNKDIFLIKRIIGIPGDTIEINNGSVYVNNKKIKEEYLPKNTLTLLNQSEYLKKVLGENKYFVLGDNRENSLDSRFEEVGVIDKENITAKKLFKLITLSN